MNDPLVYVHLKYAQSGVLYFIFVNKIHFGCNREIAGKIDAVFITLVYLLLLRDLGDIRNLWKRHGSGAYY